LKIHPEELLAKRLQHGLGSLDKIEARYNKTMKKYMIADLIKASYDEAKDERDLAIQAEMDRSDVDESVAAYLVDNWSSEADRDQVLQAAEDLGVDPQDISDDDVENINSAGSAKGEIESSLGKVFYWYSIVLGTYILTTVFDKGNPAQYPISVSELQDIRSSESFGEYFNKNIRANPEYSDKPGACGCIGDDPDKPKRLCTSEDFANMPLELREYVSRFVAIS
jgi:hypothetical protein